MEQIQNKKIKELQNKKADEITSYEDIFQKARLNGSKSAYIQEDENKTPINDYLEQRKEQFPEIFFVEKQAYIARERLPKNIQEQDFSDIKERDNVPGINVTEAIRIFLEYCPTEGMDIDKIGITSIERDVSDKNHVVVGSRLTRDDVVRLFAHADENEYEARVRQLGEFYKGYEKGAIVGHLSKVMPKGSKAGGEGLEFAIAKIGEIRYDNMENFWKELIKQYGNRALEFTEVFDLSTKPELTGLRDKLIELLPINVQKETKKTVGDFIVGQVKAQVQYGSDKTGDFVEEKAKEKIKQTEPLAEQEFKSEEERAKAMEKVAGILNDVKSIEAQAGQVRHGRMYINVEGRVSGARIAQEYEKTIDEVTTKPEDDNIEALVHSNGKDNARRLIGTGAIHALAKRGESYNAVITTTGGKKLPVKATPQEFELDTFSKKIVDELLEIVANWGGYTVKRKGKGFKTPNPDEKIVIGGARVQFLADVAEVYNLGNLKELAGLATEEFSGFLKGKVKRSEDLGEVLGKMAKSHQEATLYESGSRAEIAEGTSVEEIEEQAAAQERVIEEDKDLSQFGEAAKYIKKAEDKAMGKIGDLLSKKKKA